MNIQVVHEQPRICPGGWGSNLYGILRYKHVTQSRPDNQAYSQSNKKKKKKRKENMQNSALCCLGGSQSGIKKIEKKDKYLDIPRELLKNWNIVSGIRIVVGALGTLPKCLKRGMEDIEITEKVETTQTTAVLRLVRISEKVLKTWRDLQAPKQQWEAIG